MNATEAQPSTVDAEADREPGRHVDVLGWIGTVTVLLAHALANTDRIDDTGWMYHGLNLAGSAALGYLCVRRKVWQSVWLNAVWGVVAIVALVGIATR
ncbi:CBU_0592 family membrane protein [Planctomycetes bacterium Pla163]|uniref:CBU_0592 family membrane protein n=1 Tax=Rohdeia mirabilis TaxID=2528008 RepID=UPI0011A618B4